LTTIVFVEVLKDPVAAPRRVYVIVPSEFRTAVPNENCDGCVGSVDARRKNWSPRSERPKL